MKILHINKYYYQRGGTETYLFGLIDMQKKYGHDVVVMSMKDPRNIPSSYEKYFVEPVDFSNKEGILRTARKALKSIYSFEAKKKLELLIQTEKPDIAHIHNFHAHLTTSILHVLKKYRIPVVMTLHDFRVISPVYHLFFGEKIYEKCKGHKYYMCVVSRVIKKSYLASIVAAAESYLSYFLKTYEQNIDIFIAPSKFLRDKFYEWKFPKK